MQLSIKARLLVHAAATLLCCALTPAYANQNTDDEPATSLEVRFLSSPEPQQKAGASQADSQRTPTTTEQSYRIVRNGEELPITIKQQNQLALGRTFDPLVDTKESQARRPDVADQVQLFAVQFHTQILPAYRQMVLQAGLQIVATQSKQVLRVRGSGAQALSLQANPQVRWVGEILATDKLAAEFINLNASPKAAALEVDEQAEMLKLNVLLSDANKVAQAETTSLVERLGGRVDSQHAASDLLIVSLPAEQVLALAQSHWVEFVERWTAPETDMNNVRSLTGSNYAETQPPLLVPGVPGFTGNGVRGEVMDGNYVRTSHNDFNPNPIPHSVNGNSNDSHATAVYGIVFGDGTSNGNARGQIPDGRGIYSSYVDISNAQRANHTAELLSNPYRAVFQTNSWGNSRTFSYNSISRAFDTILFNNDVLILQSQSNAGTQDSRPQAWSKNVLAVGGVRHLNNTNRNDDYWCNSGHAITCNYNGAASIGPADDGRIKPDLSNAYDSTFTTDSGNNSDYRQFGGTSGATPITAGTAGIMFQMWAEGVLNGTPSPAGSPDTYVFANRPKVSTAKALLINTARQYPITAGGGQNIPRNIQGWGVANAQDLFIAAHNHGGALPIVVDESEAIETGQINAHTINVAGTLTNPTDRWLKATLVYKDPAAAGNPARELVNDITLRLTSPSGTVYWGNNGVDTANWSSPGGSADTRNNVENVFIQSAQEGVWQVDILGTDIGTDAHPDPGDAINAVYSLVVSCGGSNLCEDSTLPVMLSHFQSKQRGKRIRFDWLTATETFNIGFNLWAQVAGEWQQINHQMVASKNVNAVAAQRYKKSIRIDDLEAPVSAVGISSVDTSGREEFYGPFEVGEQYGENFIPEAEDWQSLRAQHQAKMQALGYRFVRGKWRKNKGKPPTERAKLKISIEQEGIYRIRYADLVAAGLDWQKVNSRTIALTLHGQGVPRHVVTPARKNSKPGRFGPGSYIDFYAAPPRGEDALYTKTAVYELSVDVQNALAAAELPAAQKRRESANWVYRNFQLGDDNLYTIYAVDKDPWVDATLFSRGQAVRKEYLFENLPEPAAGQSSKLTLSLMGGVNFPGNPFTEPDHHLRIYLNQQTEPIFDDYKDGAVEWKIELDLDNHDLRAGSNTITLELVGDNSFGADIVNVRELNLTLATPARLDAEQPVFQAGGAVQLSDTARATVAYAFDAQHNLAKINPQRKAKKQLTVPALADSGSHYWVSSEQALLQPAALELAQPLADSLVDSQTNYLIVAHPQFNNQDLADYAQQRRSEGLNVSVVDLFDIYQHYASGMPLPSAIRAYIKDLAAAAPLTHVLLVGGSSYDYHDVMGYGAISFLPTFYSKSRGFGFHTPTDNAFADVDGDDMPDVALGRWPVRSEAELTNIINKTLAWQQSGNLGDAQSALLIADADSTAVQQSYRAQVDAVAEYLVDSEGQPWTQLERVYLDEQADSAQAKQKIIDTISQGTSLTIYDGHASPAQWGSRNLFNQNDAKLFSDTGRGTQVLSLACYTTYFDEPNAKTLAQQMLFASSGGAVAIQGSIALGKFTDNELLAKHITSNQVVKGQDLGSAILNAKRRVGLSKRDAIVQWTLLGDPTLQLVNY